MGLKIPQVLPHVSGSFFVFVFFFPKWVGIFTRLNFKEIDFFIRSKVMYFSSLKVNKIIFFNPSAGHFNCKSIKMILYFSMLFSLFKFILMK